MQHEDVVKKITITQLARTLTEWHCNSFTDLIDEVEPWDWNIANKDFWSRLAKSLHSQKVSGRKNGPRTRFFFWQRGPFGRERDNVVYWKTNGKINNDLQYGSAIHEL